MPLYEYRCPDCSHHFEVLQSLGQGADDVTCPSCGRPAPEKQLSTFSSSSSGDGGASLGAGAGCGGGGGFT